MQSSPRRANGAALSRLIRAMSEISVSRARPRIAGVLIRAVLIPVVPLLVASVPAAAQRDPFEVERVIPPRVNPAWAGVQADPCPGNAALPAPLTMVQAIDFALCSNPQTRVSWANARVAAAQTGIARSAQLPTIDGNGSVQRSETRNQAGAGGQDNASVSAAVNYVLFDFGARDADLDSARQTLVAANWTHNSVLQTVLFGVVQSYYRLFAANESVSAALAAEDASRQSLDAARARQQAGRGTRADVLQAQTAYSQALLNRTRAQGDAATAAGQLAAALGLRADVKLVLSPPPDLAGFTLGEQAVERLIDTARVSRPELLAAQAQVRQAEAGLRSAQATGKPVISLFGNVGGGASNPGPDPFSGAVGVRLQVPIFTGYRSTYEILTAREQVDVRRAEFDRIGNDVSLEVWQSWQQLRSDGQSYRATLDLVASAREAFDAALARYRAGVGTLIDLLNAQSAAANADFQRIESQYNWYLSKATLVRSLGTLDPNLFAQPATP